jgi:DNA polymerase-4
MARLGIETGADLAAKDIEWLRAHFGSFADYLYRAARGIDLRPVRSSRIRKSVGGERTFSRDLSSGSELRETLEDIIDIVWGYIERAEARGRTVTLKMKYTDFQIFSRAKTSDRPIETKDEFAGVARKLLEEVLPLPMPIRLMGLTLSKLDRDGAEEPRRPDAQLSLL